MDKTSYLSDKDLDKIATLLDNRLAPLASKQDLMATKQELKDYIHEGVETIIEGMDKQNETFAEKEKVEKIEAGLKTVADKVGVKIHL